MTTGAQIEDTIAAVATPPGRGAISIVRLSGPDVVQIVSRFVGERGIPAHAKLERRVITVPGTGDPLDEGMIVFFAGPNSYSGEDLVEFHLHGSPLLVSQLMTALFANGARLARPGEFTLRAFINGKKDLTQAEAVGDIIEARSLRGLSLAAGQLLGGISQTILELAGRLLTLVSQLEAELDFPEDVPEVTVEHLAGELGELGTQLRKLASSYDSVRAWKEGYKVVLAGATNVGKSSLFNALLGRDRAIVTEEAGTTRDYLEEYMPGAPVPVLLVDTAGIRRTESVAEQAGVSLSTDRIRTANLVFFVLDTTRSRGDEDDRIDALTSGVPRLTVVTKRDLAGVATVGHRTADALAVSSVTGEGIDALRDLVFSRAADELSTGDFAVSLTSRRQQDAVVRTLAVVDEALEQLEMIPRDIFTSRLKEALHHLSEVTGKGPVTEQILDEIFSSFCIGK